MTEPLPTRPPQVTLAAWLIMIGGGWVVLAAFETIAGLRSIETRETLEQILEVPPYSGLGLDISGLRQVIKVAAMVAGACAAVAAPSAYLVLRRDRTARIVLSIVALPMLVAGFVASVFLTSLVAMSVVLLWLQPARAWFAGTWTPPPGAAKVPRPNVPEPRVPEPTAPDPASLQPQWPQQPTEPLRQPAQPVPGAYGAPLPGWPGPPSARWPRPPALIWAAVLTWAFSGLALMLAAFAVALVASDPDWTIDQFRSQNPTLSDQGLSDDELIRGTYAAAGVLVVWSLAACAAAGLAFLGWRGGRVALAAVLAGTGFWLAISVLLGQPVMLVPLLAAVAAFWLLHRPEVRRWCAARRGGMNP